jgi:osmoprotectant transport system permease protein
MSAPSEPRTQRSGVSGRTPLTPLRCVRGSACIALLALLAAGCGPPAVGSKAFPESLILGEMTAQLARSRGVEMAHDRTRGLGGTQVLWEALVNGDIVVYPEYTGTITQQIFAGRRLDSDDAIRAALAEHGVRMSGSLGFNDTYALGMKEATAERLHIRTISDLRAHPELRFRFSNEYMERGDDGWARLRQAYDLPQKDVRGMEHSLALQALAGGDIDVTELYSTDAEIRAGGLRVLQDDRHFFPAYRAVLLYRADFADKHPEVIEEWRRLEGTISEDDMIGMNERAKLKHEPEGRVAADFLRARFGVSAAPPERGLLARLGDTTLAHLFLVAVSLTAAVVVAVPLGVWAARRPRQGQVILGAAGVLQTIPSLALLALLIPLFHLGAGSAIVALFLYSLLPIVRNTYAGLHDIPPQVRESAEALGLPRWARLRLIELPLASRSILAGIKTSAVINVGTATLGGLIGAGGYGQPIFKGIPLIRTDLILEGAVPAALMALLVQWAFELAERRVVPRGLRLRPDAG